MEEIKNPWTALSKEEQYDNPWINVTEYQVINPGGGRGIYGKVSYKNEAIGIIPIDDEDNTWLVGQYRFTLSEYSWEIPEGGCPMGENSLQAAERELREETGLSAKKMEMVLKMHNSNSVSDEVAYIFMATGLTQGESQLEETESDLVVKKLPFKEALAMVLEGKITDAMSVAGILKIARIKGY